MYVYIINMYNYIYIYKYVNICIRMYINKTQLPTEFPHFIASLDARIGGEVLQETKKTRIFVAYWLDMEKETHLPN